MTGLPGIDPALAKNYFANLEYDFRPDGQKVTIDPRLSDPVQPGDVVVVRESIF